MSAFGSPDAFLPNVTYLLGVQSFSGADEASARPLCIESHNAKHSNVHCLSVLRPHRRDSV